MKEKKRKKNLFPFLSYSIIFIHPTSFASSPIEEYFVNHLIIFLSLVIDTLIFP